MTFAFDSIFATHINVNFVSFIFYFIYFFFQFELLLLLFSILVSGRRVISFLICMIYMCVLSHGYTHLLIEQFAEFNNSLFACINQSYDQVPFQNVQIILTLFSMDSTCFSKITLLTNNLICFHIYFIFLCSAHFMIKTK